MASERCIDVRYLYKIDPISNSSRWHMNCNANAKHPAQLEPGIVSVTETADTVVIIFNVPCGADGKVPQEIQADYEDMADAKFLETCPGAELA